MVYNLAYTYLNLTDDNHLLSKKNALWKNMKLKNPYSLLMLAGIGCVSHLSNGWQSQKEKSRGGGVFNYIQPTSRSKK